MKRRIKPTFFFQLLLLSKLLHVSLKPSIHTYMYIYVHMYATVGDEKEHMRTQSLVRTWPFYDAANVVPYSCIKPHEKENPLSQYLVS